MPATDTAAGMMVHMTRGKGEVLTAATCEWVMGLKRGDPFTQRITRNVLDRFTSRLIRSNHAGPTRKSFPSGRIWPPSTMMVVPVM